MHSTLYLPPNFDSAFFFIRSLDDSKLLVILWKYDTSGIFSYGTLQIPLVDRMTILS